MHLVVVFSNKVYIEAVNNLICHKTQAQAAMEPPFDQWNIHKKRINNDHKRPFFKQNEVWWCHFGVNVGHEQDGKGERFTRPVLVIKKYNPQIFIGLPLSTKLKDNDFYHRLWFKGSEQSVMLSQIRVFDAKRLGDKMGEIPSKEMSRIKQKLKELML